MEPIDKWTELSSKEYFISIDPYSWQFAYKIPYLEPEEEKIPTFNEPRLNQTIMEPIDKWVESTFKMEKYARINLDVVSLYSSIKVWSEPEEKTPTFNEPRLKPIKL